jgi:hypothetical protein
MQWQTCADRKCWSNPGAPVGIQPHMVEGATISIQAVARAVREGRCSTGNKQSKLTFLCLLQYATEAGEPSPKGLHAYLQRSLEYTVAEQQASSHSLEPSERLTKMVGDSRRLKTTADWKSFIIHQRNRGTSLLVYVMLTYDDTSVTKSRELLRRRWTQLPQRVCSCVQESVVVRA